MAQGRRRRRSNWPIEVEAEIERLAMKDVSAAVIRKELRKRYEDSDIPKERAIENRLAAVRSSDLSGPWTLQGASGEEAALVLPVLGAVIEETEGRTTQLSRDMTEWIIRIRRAAPDLPPWNAYLFARRYLSAPQQTETLDQLLALAPWREPTSRCV